MISENHHLTIDTESTQVDSVSSMSKTGCYHAHLETGSHIRFQQHQQHQQHHHQHPHHRRLLNPEYCQKPFSRSRSRSPCKASTHRPGQEGYDTLEADHDGISPNALAQKLELLVEADPFSQQRDPAELQRENEERLQDIIARLDKNASEQDPLDLDVSETIVVDDQSPQLNPALLKDHRTLQQHHGNANIRHS